MKRFNLIEFDEWQEGICVEFLKLSILLLIYFFMRASGDTATGYQIQSGTNTCWNSTNLGVKEKLK